MAHVVVLCFAKGAVPAMPFANFTGVEKAI